MAVVKPARFARFTRQQIALHNLLITRKPNFELGNGQEAFSLSLQPLLKPQKLPHLIALSVASDSAWLALSHELFSALLAPWTMADEALAPALHDAVLSAALSGLLREFRPLLGGRMSLRQEVQAPPKHALALGLWETDCLAVGQPEAILYLDAATAAQLRDSLQHRMGVLSWDSWPTLAVELVINAGQMRLSVDELVTLENGDILLLPAQINANTHEMILLQRESVLAAGRLEGRRFIINRFVETLMSDNTQADGDEPLAIADPGALEITLRFDLGQLTMPLGELQQIQPGYSFELDQAALGEVRIVAGTQLIGRGELVQIDDRLGVRVTALFKPDHV